MTFLKITTISLLLLSTFGFVKSEYYEESFILMGTFVNIKVDNKGNCKKAVSAAIKEMKRLEIIFNLFDVNSELYKINNDKNKLNGIIISDEFLELLNLSFYINKISDGLFDPTVQPILDIWGFYSKDKNKAPEGNIIKIKLAQVGMRNIEVDKTKKIIRFKNEGTKLDFNAVAKGYIVDKAANILKNMGVEKGIVDAGGDISCFGKSEFEQWTIGMRHPKFKDRIIASIKIKNKAAATSGGYENYIIIDNEKLAHIINPKTGYPVKNNVLSSTVISNKCVISDGLATALFILKPEEGLKLIEGLKDVDCIIISEEGGKLRFTISQNIMDRVEIL